MIGKSQKDAWNISHCAYDEKLKFMWQDIIAHRLMFPHWCVLIKFVITITFIYLWKEVQERALIAPEESFPHSAPWRKPAPTMDLLTVLKAIACLSTHPSHSVLPSPKVWKEWSFFCSPPLSFISHHSINMLSRKWWICTWIFAYWVRDVDVSWHHR